MTAAIDLIAAGKAEGLICYSLDRLAREITVQEAILAAVWEAGGRVFTTDHGEVLQDNPDDPMRTGMRKMAGVMYELDRLFVVARLRRGRRLKADRGGFAGGGVRYGLTTERKQLVPHQAEHDVARRRLHRGGLSIRKIADQLNAEQVPGQARRCLAPRHRRPSPPGEAMTMLEDRHARFLTSIRPRLDDRALLMVSEHGRGFWTVLDPPPDGADSRVLFLPEGPGLAALESPELAEMIAEPLTRYDLAYVPSAADLPGPFDPARDHLG